jgi:hypothetical protein
MMDIKQAVKTCKATLRHLAMRKAGAEAHNAADFVVEELQQEYDALDKLIRYAEDTEKIGSGPEDVQGLRDEPLEAQAPYTPLGTQTGRMRSDRPNISQPPSKGGTDGE